MDGLQPIEKRKVLRKLLVIYLLLAVLSVTGIAQTDSLIFKNGDIVVGEIKSMALGVLTFKTDYSDSDFKIEWNEIEQIYIETLLYITLRGGKYYYGWITTQSDSIINIVSRDGKVIPARLNDIVHLVPIKRSFKDRFGAEIDIGFSFARSKNLRQLASANMIEYKAEKWTSHITYNALLSTQDDVDPIRRRESDMAFNYIIFRNWLLIPSIKYLSNTEQSLKYRWNVQYGIGKYLLRTNNALLGFKLGINSNHESFTDDTSDNHSWEGFFGTEINLSDMGDLNFYSNILAYPGITEHGRWRVDWTLRFKYDLPFDFYIKLDFSLNYDNLSHEGASKSDFISTTGLGWEW